MKYMKNYEKYEILILKKTLHGILLAIVCITL